MKVGGPFRTTTSLLRIRRKLDKDMATPVINYDEIGDTLTVTFSPGEKAIGIELNDHILLRINKAERRAVGLTFFEYSILSQHTEVGVRSFPLTGLDELSGELRQLVLEVLLHPPVSDILTVSAYTPSVTEMIPITSLQPLAVAA
jgi:hypothetical protein